MIVLNGTVRNVYGYVVRGIAVVAVVATPTVVMVPAALRDRPVAVSVVIQPTVAAANVVQAESVVTIPAAIWKKNVVLPSVVTTGFAIRARYMGRTCRLRSAVTAPAVTTISWTRMTRSARRLSIAVLTYRARVMVIAALTDKPAVRESAMIRKQKDVVTERFMTDLQRSVVMA